MLTLRDFFSSEIVYVPDINPTAVQLKEYYEMERKLESVLRKRAGRDVKNPVKDDWLRIVQSNSNYDRNNDISVKAAEQQAQALAMMGCKKLSVLAGGAGTGKTAVVRSFLKSETIRNEGVLLLAPTGKARVRLGKEAEDDDRIKALTIAQFLMRYGRYEISQKYMRPVSNPTGRKYSEARNIIIDECSMLPTKELAVLIEALDPVRINRIILIGDPNQLPPIGAGRPFADLYHYLRREKINEKDKSLSGAVTHLEHVVRTVNGRASDILNLAAWFSNGKPRKEAEDIFDKIEQGNLDNDLKVYCWENELDLISKLEMALCEEFECGRENLGKSIKSFIGTNDLRSLKSHPDLIENLQILTPVLNPAWGVYALNAHIQEWIKSGSKDGGMQFSTQFIYSGDKVMQLRNEKKVGFPPSSELYQLSNGQIGFVDNISSSYCNIVYSGLPERSFGFKCQKGDESDIAIELAYAISIHKSQGSDFDTVVVVLPKAGRIISRELIYTALTRAKKKLILLVEESIHWLYGKSRPEASILATRNTNLFNYSVRTDKTEIPYIEGLIHRTKPDTNGYSHIVRSKSEVIIANELISANLDFSYEKRLPEDYPKRYLPDFTFVDDGGEIVIWEHLGMLSVPEYRIAWEKKKSEYEKMGFIEGETLFITQDHSDGSIDTNEVIDVIN
ncbi:MAG: AAA family ATPase, partial [Muribaculaceae bacterium]|nr:AAA family ATPase [Muribaculaceae bacterium]